MDENSTNHSQVLKTLEALKQASHDLQTNNSGTSSFSSSIRSLLELQNTESASILSLDPHLSAFSTHLSDLKYHVETLDNSRGYSPKAFFARRASSHSISRLAGSIETEIQAWIDRETVEDISGAIQDLSGHNEDKIVDLLTRFSNRVLQGFNREFQHLVLKSKLFQSLESVLCNSKCSKKVREHAASALSALISFNKNVFVGQFLMGEAVLSLSLMGSTHSIKVLCELIRTIKSPIVDEIESNGLIPNIITSLNSKELDLRIASMDCILEIGYFGRREAIEAMLNEGLIKKLVELQRSDLGGDLIDLEVIDDGSGVSAGGVEWRRSSRERLYMEGHPFASCVARFAVQLEVGEGLRQREKRAFKQQILEGVPEVTVSDAEASTIIAEVLWGSSP